MTKQKEIRILTRSAFSGLLVELHKNPMEGESNLVEVATANYLRLLHSKDVVIRVDNKTIKEQIGYIPAGYVAVVPLIEGD